MTLAILILLLVFTLLLILFVFSIIAQLIRLILGEAPYVPTGKKALAELINTIPLTEKTILYELGCGDARVLIECHRIEPRATYIGIEKNLIPYCLAQWNLWRYGNPKSITLLKKNIFSIDYTKATILYTYLLPATLDLLLPKLEQELQKGTPVISPTFRFTKKQPNQTIPLSEAKKEKSLIQEVHISVF